jgi:hypothetical protein
VISSLHRRFSKRERVGGLNADIPPPRTREQATFETLSAQFTEADVAVHLHYAIGLCVNFDDGYLHYLQLMDLIHKLDARSVHITPTIARAIVKKINVYLEQGEVLPPRDVVEVLPKATPPPPPRDVVEVLSKAPPSSPPRDVVKVLRKADPPPQPSSSLYRMPRPPSIPKPSCASAPLSNVSLPPPRRVT